MPFNQMVIACSKDTLIPPTATMVGAELTADGAGTDLSLLPDLPDPAIKVCRDRCCVVISARY